MLVRAYIKQHAPIQELMNYLLDLIRRHTNNVNDNAFFECSSGINHISIVFIVLF